MQNDDKIALFDLDGSLADFDAALRRDLVSMRSADEPDIDEGANFHDLEEAHPWAKVRMDFIKRRPGWWRSLARIESGFAILREAERIGFKINVLTKAPRLNAGAWTEKVEWCQTQPELVNADIHLTMNKGLVYGSLLFDDYPVYMGQWLAHRPRGLGIMPARPDNADFQHPNVLRWDGTNLDEIVRAMELVYAREPNETLRLV